MVTTRYKGDVPWSSEPNTRPRYSGGILANLRWDLEVMATSSDPSSEGLGPQGLGSTEDRSEVKTAMATSKLLAVNRKCLLTS